MQPGPQPQQVAPSAPVPIAPQQDVQPMQPVQQPQQAVPAAVQPDPEAADEKPKKPRSKHWLAKRIAIISGSVVGGLAAIYLIGVAVFSFHYMPNTHISNIDLTLKTPEEVRQDFDLKVDDYSIKVKGKGLNIVITSDDAGIKIDSAAMTKEISRRQNPWKWPVEVFYDHDVTDTLSNSLSASKLADVVRAQVDAINVDAKDPVNAYAAYSPETKQFEVVPEVKGTKLDYDKVLANILIGTLNLDDHIIIVDDSLVPPSVLKDDKRLLAAQKGANDLIKADIQLTMGGAPTVKCTSDEISQWVAITPEFEAVLSEEPMNAWAAEVADMHNTVGSKRSFTRADGKAVNVSGGDYGWKVDKDALVGALVQAVKDRTVGNLEVPVLQSGSGYVDGGRDWGTRYIDVDISEQYARFYGDNGAIIWEAPIVSGAPGGRATPTGVYDLNTKGRNVTLTGRENGEITYQTPVAYWMPFIRNSIGFHDATWQSGFGGQRYRQGAGSHGCINLSLSKAEELYGLIQVGDVVVVHY